MSDSSVQCIAKRINKSKTNAGTLHCDTKCDFCVKSPCCVHSTQMFYFFYLYEFGAKILICGFSEGAKYNTQQEKTKQLYSLFFLNFKQQIFTLTGKQTAVLGELGTACNLNSEPG